ncbi:MAG TPA: hypothetical protein DEB28_07555 [Hyphomonas sp.]|nr:hypothetical protein [Hyphomonas sp.]HAW56832.1 hypothetical protein [Hyphomonas sp.]HBJ40558.1 hypothetical protein [Hyphomonas sp.]HBU33979.1 hypothetical protein [Hyphomonas sp.]HBX98666.1 hypothetical protein [Hyphomonas sp.]
MMITAMICTQTRALADMTLCITTSRCALHHWAVRLDYINRPEPIQAFVDELIEPRSRHLPTILGFVPLRLMPSIRTHPLAIPFEIR